MDVYGIPPRIQIESGGSYIPATCMVGWDS